MLGLAVDLWARAKTGCGSFALCGCSGREMMMGCIMEDLVFNFTFGGEYGLAGLQSFASLKNHVYTEKTGSNCIPTKS